MRLQKRLVEIERAGGHVAAISVDAPARTAAMLDRLPTEGGEGARIAFPVLSDPGGKTAQAYGVYDREHDIALPATVIVSPLGEIVWTHVGDTITDRPPEDEIIAALGRARRQAR